MKWIEQVLVADYGKKQWGRFTDSEKVDIITSFCNNLNKIINHGI